VWYLYILQCSDGSFYTGITVDMDKRLHLHNSGKGARYTRSRRPCDLIYFEECDSESTARRRELEIKSWRRAKKEDLVSGFSRKTP
jgi:putative endonuclease